MNVDHAQSGLPIFCGSFLSVFVPRGSYNFDRSQPSQENELFRSIFHEKFAPHTTCLWHTTQQPTPKIPVSHHSLCISTKHHKHSRYYEQYSSRTTCLRKASRTPPKKTRESLLLYLDRNATNAYYADVLRAITSLATTREVAFFSRKKHRKQLPRHTHKQ